MSPVPGTGVRGAVLVALFAALTAVGAFVRIPLPGGVPLTLQLPAVLLAGAVLGPALGAASQAAYLACGLLGLPIFASGGGAGYVLVPTFGFLVGFIPAAAVVGIAAGDPRRSAAARVFFAMTLGVLADYLVGVPWFGWNMAAIQGKEVPPALLRRMALVLLPLDLVKAALLLPLVRLVRARPGLLPPARAEAARGVRERGVVVERRGPVALVRVAAPGPCAGCAAAGACRGEAGGPGRLVEARNAPDVPAGAEVEIALDAGAVRRETLRRWLYPLAGLGLGAAVAELLATPVLGAPAAARAAGLGGIAGTAAGVILARRRAGGVLPEITRRVG